MERRKTMRLHTNPRTSSWICVFVRVEVIEVTRRSALYQNAGCVYTTNWPTGHWLLAKQGRIATSHPSPVNPHGAGPLHRRRSFTNSNTHPRSLLTKQEQASECVHCALDQCEGS